MKAQIYGLELTNGHRIPFYHLPWTKQEMLDLFGFGGIQFSNHAYKWQFATGDYYTGEILQFMRTLIHKWQSGMNPNGALSTMPTGIAHPKKNNVGVNGVSFNITAGTTDFQAGPVIDRYGTTTSVTLNSPSGNSVSRWFNSGSTEGPGNTYRLEPAINETLNGEDSWESEIFPSFHCITSDGVQCTIDFTVEAAGFGWQSFKLSAVGSSSFNWLQDYDPEWDQTFIEEIGEEEPEMPRFDPTSVPTVGVYVVNQGDLLNLFGDMWNRNFWEAFNQIFAGDPSNALMSVRYYYGMASAVAANLSADDGPVTLGNTVIGQEAGVSVKHLTNNIVTFSCGVVTVPRKYGDQRDYTQCIYRIWVPFVGWVDMNPDDLLAAGQVCLTYVVNLSTGEAMVFATENDDAFAGGFADSYWSQSCSMGVDIPYAITSSQSLGSVAVSMLSLGGVSGSQFTPNEGTFSSGNAMGHASVTDLEPKLVVYQKDDLTSADHKEASGLPTGQTSKMGDLTGFVQIENAYNASFVLANRRMGEIIQQLRDGVYL